MSHVSSVVHAPLTFLAGPAPDGTKPVNYLYPPPHGGAWENCAYDPRDVDIADARLADEPPTLDTCGFELHDAPTRVRDFHDPDAVAGRYSLELCALALQATGAREAHVFDHLVRRREPDRRAMTFGRHADGIRTPGPAGRVHNDYTDASARRRLALVLGDEAAAAVPGRWCIVNIWRSTGQPVLDAPLAFCDARSVQPQHLVASDILYPQRMGEIYQLVHAPGQRWSYFPMLQPDEALVFKQFDSDDSVARFVPHAAFDDPTTPPGAPLRESIEARILVLY